MTEVLESCWKFTGRIGAKVELDAVEVKLVSNRNGNLDLIRGAFELGQGQWPRYKAILITKTDPNE